MLNLKKHLIILNKIFQDIYSDKELTSQLIFKGGSCLMLFYGLDRFSTDLDFNIRAKSVNVEAVEKILKKNAALEEYYEKKHTYFWQASYEYGQRKIKIEINKRLYPTPQKIAYKDYYGLTIATLAPEQMFAHKLSAIGERSKNRDLYDAWFMFEKNWDIDEGIIRDRTGKTVKEYLLELAEEIPNSLDKRGILNELGEVLYSDEQKKWAKNNLINTLIRQMKIRGDLS
ncbi:MAG: nucleotidyl transferase AbiEii/AbiGii toxin family protein [Elusimicrobiota bacterium]|jgi:predicted nucleotidyltransferase component of viral defense system|nr:nucleotidyl transferase AbiEii/AbiGii toxin family protein [Elusimicrobiota bacterium]